MSSIARVLAIVVVLTLGQTSEQSFVGTWTSEVGGRTFARLELHVQNGALGGRISLGAVHFDPNGKVDEVLKTATNFTPLFDIVIREGLLSFARKDEEDTDRFQMRVSDDTAVLTFLITDKFREELNANGIAPPQPMQFRRVAR